MFLTEPIPKTYVVAGLAIDITFIIMYLVRRKSKGWKEKSYLNRRDGAIIVILSVLVLALAHLGNYQSYWEYLEGLLIDSFLFFLGMKLVVSKNE
ncbi:hypothetical protein B6F84_10415 [Acidianus manzaensis]|uniref:Uncharacterized protein n=1 Tax=Acidianus manzaensis TaxID=282676 RepID=A0A1W6K1P3_9CREN|nr:hypothetical protein B6F84_10415 [Acidianus manzaensis]